MDGTPNGYHIMSVTGSTYSVSYRAAGKPDARQMRITIEKPDEKKLESRIPLSMVSDFKVVVNLFDGGENSSVSCRIDNREPFSLKHVFGIDTVTFKSYENTGSFISGREIPSTHIWSGTFDRHIKTGVHRITVLAVDEYGRNHSGLKIFEVVDDTQKKRAEN